MLYTLPPFYDPGRHPIETWQEWYLQNQPAIQAIVDHEQQGQDYEFGVNLRTACPYEYTDSLNQRQIWEPFLTGFERQEFDRQLRNFMYDNQNAGMRVRPAPFKPPD